MQIGKGLSMVDNEHSTFEKGVINGYEADIYKRTSEDYDNIIVVYYEPYDTNVTIVGTISIDELTKIAEAIRIVKQN
ncbi:MAG: DUF4367 domain-containing protein [Lachnospiraceae bacterium]|nr:DUF4367 domain-containing protein [Lachnospiraceae bacterium]